MLTMLATGLAIDEIGEVVILSPSAVRARLMEIADMLGIRKNKARSAALVAWAWRNLICEPH